MFSGGVKSLHGYTCAQIYGTDFGWMKVYPMISKADAHLTLDLLHHEYGVFHRVVPDDAKELTQKDYLRKARKAGSIIHPVKPFSPN
jgi:hypothetical protein